MGKLNLRFATNETTVEKDTGSLSKETIMAILALVNRLMDCNVQHPVQRNQKIATAISCNESDYKIA